MKILGNLIASGVEGGEETTVTEIGQLGRGTWEKERERRDLISAKREDV